MSLDEKIFLAEGIRSNNNQRTFGITPSDYKIYVKLGRIDFHGEEQLNNDKYNLGCEAESSDDTPNANYQRNKKNQKYFSNSQQREKDSEDSYRESEYKHKEKAKNKLRRIGTLTLIQ